MAWYLREIEWVMLKGPMYLFLGFSASSSLLLRSGEEFAESLFLIEFCSKDISIVFVIELDSLRLSKPNWGFLAIYLLFLIYLRGLELLLFYNSLERFTFIYLSIRKSLSLTELNGLNYLENSKELTGLSSGKMLLFEITREVEKSDYWISPPKYSSLTDLIF